MTLFEFDQLRGSRLLHVREHVLVVLLDLLVAGEHFRPEGVVGDVLVGGRDVAAGEIRVSRHQRESDASHEGALSGAFRSDQVHQVEVPGQHDLGGDQLVDEGRREDRRGNQLDHEQRHVLPPVEPVFPGCPAVPPVPVLDDRPLDVERRNAGVLPADLLPVVGRRGEPLVDLLHRSLQFGGEHGRTELFEHAHYRGRKDP